MNNLLELGGMKILKNLLLMIVMMKVPPNDYVLPIVPKGYVMNEKAAMEILACNDRNDLKKLLAKWSSSLLMLE